VERLDRHAAAEGVADEPSVGLGLPGQVVDVVETPDADAARRVGLRLVLQRGPQVLRRGVTLGLPVDLELVAVRVAEQVGGADPGVAVDPADAEAALLERSPGSSPAPG